VVSEQVGTLRKVESLLNGLQAFQAGGWMVQLLLVEASQSSQVDLGIDTDLDIEVSAAFSSSSSTAEYGGTARAALKADISSQRVELFAQPLLLCVDGGKSSVKRVEVVPVAEYTTLETGAVVTSGYSEIEVGLQCQVGVRADGDGGALVNYDVSLGEIQSYVDNRVPVRTQESLQGEVVMQSGGTYLLGSLERGKSREGLEGVLQLSKSTTREGTRLEVWAMAVEVRKSSGVIGAPGINVEVMENE
jgi:type II secretory pathway component HofQ